jgi:hypothetical protein
VRDTKKIASQQKQTHGWRWPASARAGNCWNFDFEPGVVFAFTWVHFGRSRRTSPNYWTSGHCIMMFCWIYRWRKLNHSRHIFLKSNYYLEE